MSSGGAGDQSGCGRDTGLIWVDVLLIAGRLDESIRSMRRALQRKVRPITDGTGALIRLSGPGAPHHGPPPYRLANSIKRERPGVWFRAGPAQINGGIRARGSRLFPRGWEDGPLRVAALASALGRDPFHSLPLP
ncbi:hypothetical protein AAFF_G00207000 [Aldrovandia affinis]|uniref:Uncharacterized protein n=1 Tax=Aldrovandia affinis TaxID=143900 RepID=A0AAD7W654_9TELE|nr:hypothetical protein AAFF_G00207000 [Aldrovandia affinis]